MGISRLASAQVAARKAVTAVVAGAYLRADGSELGHEELVRVPGTPERFFARSEAT